MIDFFLHSITLPLLNVEKNMAIFFVIGLAEGLALPAIFQIFSENVPKEERAKAFSYLVSGGSVGQVVASVVSSMYQVTINLQLLEIASAVRSSCRRRILESKSTKGGFYNVKSSVLTAVYRRIINKSRVRILQKMGSRPLD